MLISRMTLEMTRSCREYQHFSKMRKKKNICLLILTPNQRHALNFNSHKKYIIKKRTILI